MNKTYAALVPALLAIVLSACGTTGGGPGSGDVAVEDRGTDSGMGMDDGGSGAQAMGAGTAGQFSLQSLDDPASPLASRVVYFSLDSTEIADADRDVLAAHAALLAANPSVSITLGGHADERGSREYNIGLGDRRAQAVRRLLEFQGAAPDQLRTVSYGEEKPAVMGHDESAWRMNRRVELVYPDR